MCTVSTDQARLATTVCFAEMTLPEFYHFLSEIQKAKAVMDSY